MLPSRKSIRLSGYDYSQSGMYFITICSHGKLPIFGNIIAKILLLSEIGKIVNKEWQKTATIRRNIELDDYVIMPNHLHGIITIINDKGRGTVHRAPTHEIFGKPTTNSIPTIIRSFKATTTKQINILRNSPGSKVWQRGYYEHVIRNEEALERIRDYIVTNPENWSRDIDNPDQSGKDFFKAWLDQYIIAKPIDNPYN